MPVMELGVLSFVRLCLDLYSGRKSHIQILLRNILLNVDVIVSDEKIHYSECSPNYLL